MMASRKEQRGTRNAELDFSCPHCGVLTCTECHRPFAASRFGNNVRCAHCRAPLNKLEQIRQLLSHWYYPRRWRADLVKPNVPYLVERLWTANGQGERLYAGVGPKYTNYDIFRNMVTRLMIRGIDEGWAELKFPQDPLAEDPQYVLTIVDSERFAEGVEKLFPEVDWDEPVSASVAEAMNVEPPKRAKKTKKK